MKRLLAVLLWSVIAAAFVGPGTVTTAAAAGASRGLALLWALTFSTIACFVLQEASARLTIVSGRELGAALRERFRTRASWAAASAVFFGCAAYEAGNILGGVAGLRLVVDLPTSWSTLVLGVAAALLLVNGAPRSVARALSVAVGLMGLAFLAAAVGLGPAPGPLAVGAIVPRIPPGSEMIVLGLLGTTVVPYNLFLGSGLAAGGERLDTMRFGLAIAVGFGGLISMGVLVAGTALSGELSFEALAAVLAARLGPWAAPLLGLGLLAAGFSSAVTAPLAAALAVRSVASPGQDDRWHPGGWRFRAVWGSVLLTGVAFGVSGIRPIPVILLAQALNGLLLPVVAIFLFVAVNDRALMGAAVNGRFANLLFALVVAVALLLGCLQLARAAAGALGTEPPGLLPVALVTGAAGLTVLALLARRRAGARRG